MKSAAPPPSRAQAQKLAAYLPGTLVRQILHDGLPAPGQPHNLLAATLFADISGFTAMSEELATDGPRGAEEVNRMLRQTFTAMVNVIHAQGGAINHFYGDAMSVYFPDEDGQAAARALSCARQMQRLMRTRFYRVQTSRPAGKNAIFPLTIKIGLGYGRCQEWIIGNPAASLEFVLAGPAVDEAAQAEKQASAGQTVASCTFLRQIGQPCPQPFALLEADLPAPAAQPLLDWSIDDAAAWQRLITAAPPFISTALQQRLSVTGLEVLAEHRPVTSLFVQFELADQEETAVFGQQLQQYYSWACQMVARFARTNGRVNRVLTGDKGNQLHIIFGAPVAPDAPEQAMRCALALQRERPAFVTTQHIGLCTGKVFAGPVGSEERHEYTVVGDVVNISARLMAVCPPDEVLTDSHTAERVGNLLEFEKLDARQVKGKQTAVTPYRIVGERAVLLQLQAYFGAERPLIGRTAEMALLLAKLETARQGAGSLAAISGGAGVGKTRLLGEIVRHWQNQGGTTLLGICHPHTADTPYGAWQTIWQSFFHLTPGMAPAAQAAAVQEATRALWPNAGDDVGLWAEVLGLPIPQAPHLAELTAAARQARFFTLALRCLLGHERPLLVVVENIHWADQATLALIESLTPHLANAAIFLAITLRDGRREGRLHALLEYDSCTHLALADLSPQEGRNLLQDLVGVGALTPSIERQLGLRDREGQDSPINPLFLREAVNVLLDVGVLARENGRLIIHEARLSQVQLPDTIHGLLLARLDRLPPASRDLLQVASVIGRQFGIEPLRVMLPGLTRSALNDLLSSLSAEEMTRLITADPEWIYLFQHAMTHEVAYESLPYVRRQSLHAGLANWLETAHADNLKPIHAILAYHYGRANDHERALKFALAGANDARNVFANGDAVELYTLAEKYLQVLGIEERWETAVELFLGRSEALRFLGEFAEAVAYAERALALAHQHGQNSLVVAAHNLLAELKYRQADHQAALNAAEMAIDKWVEGISLDELARAHHWAGLAKASLQYFAAALAHLQQAEQISLQTNNKKRLGQVLEGMAYVYYAQKDLGKAQKAMHESVALSRHYSIPANVASTLNNLALVQAMLGMAEEALQTYNEAVELLQEISHNFLAHVLVNRAAIRAYLGHFAASVADFESALAHFERVGDEYGLVETHLLWGYEYHCPRGEWEAARTHFNKAAQFIEQKPDGYQEERLRLWLGYGQLSLESNALAETFSRLTEIEALIASGTFGWWETAVAYLKGRALIAAGNQLEGKRLLLQGEELVAAGGCPEYWPLALLALAQATPEEEQRQVYLQAAVAAANKRARFADRMKCLQAMEQI